MAIGDVNLGQELLNVPMGSMIKQMALAIAEGQWELDKTSMTVMEMMSGQRLLRDLDTGKLINPMSDGSPRIVDSRVYFGYTYEQAKKPDGTLDTKSKVVGKVYTMPSLSSGITWATGSDASTTLAKDEAKKLKDTKYEAKNLAGAKTKLRAALNAITGLNAADKNTIEGKLLESHGADKTENVPIMVRKPNKVSMMELGFAPAFYQFVDTIIEVKIAIKITGMAFVVLPQFHKTLGAPWIEITGGLLQNALFTTSIKFSTKP